jgi:hypothetical protein
MPMPSWKRCLVWLLVTSLLVALGVGIYRMTPPAPRCVIVVEGVDAWIAREGRWLATLLPPWHNANGNVWNGPLQLWDTRTGKELATFLSKQACLTSSTLSKDGRYFAAESIRPEDVNKKRSCAKFPCFCPTP